MGASALFAARQRGKTVSLPPSQPEHVHGYGRFRPRRSGGRLMEVRRWTVSFFFAPMNRHPACCVDSTRNVVLTVRHSSGTRPPRRVLFTRGWFKVNRESVLFVIRIIKLVNISSGRIRPLGVRILYYARSGHQHVSMRVHIEFLIRRVRSSFECRSSKPLLFCLLAELQGVINTPRYAQTL